MLELRMASVAIIIVTYNDRGAIHQTLETVFHQTKKPQQVIVVDSGSTDPSFLYRYHGDERLEMIFSPTNIGFTGGNNLGYLCINPDTDYVLFLNPDVFLAPNYLEKAIALMDTNLDWGALTGVLEGYSLKTNSPTGLYDSTGIFQTWYGKWYDRSQGDEIQDVHYNSHESVAGICGAAFFARKKALEQVQTNRQEIFDAAFFMYKEDIDLSIRLRKAGWILMFCPELKAYHCRGWNRDRTRVPRQFRLMSAKNELVVHLRMKSPVSIGYSLAKYAAVRLLNV